MFIHADFSQPVIIKPEDYHWVKSPGGEVDRMTLDQWMAYGKTEAFIQLVSDAVLKGFKPYQVVLGL